jgi:hypothetical protein
MFPITCHRFFPPWGTVFAATGLGVCWYFHSFTLWTQILSVSCSNFIHHIQVIRTKNWVLTEPRLHGALFECIPTEITELHGWVIYAISCFDRSSDADETTVRQISVSCRAQVTLLALRFGIRGLMDWDNQSRYIVSQQVICGTTWFITALTRAEPA